MNSQHYYTAVKQWRNGLTQIQQNYNRKLEKLESFKGSAGYENERQKAEKERTEAVQALRADASKSLHNAIGLMRKQAAGRTVPPPTQEHLNLLQALKMRTSLTIDDLQHAANTMEGDPVALSVLDDLATEHNVIGLKASLHSTLTDSDVARALDTLERSTNTLLKLETIKERRGDYLKSTAYYPDALNDQAEAAAFFRVDRDATSPDDCIEMMSLTNNVGEFMKIVD